MVFKQIAERCETPKLTFRRNDDNVKRLVGRRKERHEESDTVSVESLQTLAGSEPVWLLAEAIAHYQARLDRTRQATGGRDIVGKVAVVSSQRQPVGMTTNNSVRVDE